MFYYSSIYILTFTTLEIFFQSTHLPSTAILRLLLICKPVVPTARSVIKPVPPSELFLARPQAGLNDKTCQWSNTNGANWTPTLYM